jgi:hypothetical protein
VELEISRQIFEKFSYIRFNENLSIWDPSCSMDRRTDRQIDMMEMVVAFLSSADAPKNICTIILTCHKISNQFYISIYVIEYYLMLWLVGVESGRLWTLYTKDDSLDVSGVEQRSLGPASSLVIVLSCRMNVVQDVHIYIYIYIYICGGGEGGLIKLSYVLGDDVHVPSSNL